MDARTFLKEYGSGEASSVCERAGTNLAYFKQLAYRHRRPSPALAQRLAESSSHRLDVMSLLFPPTDIAPAPQQAAWQRAPDKQHG